jgi:hypothetical protein
MEAMRFVESPQNGVVTIYLPYELQVKEKLEIIVMPYEEKKKKKAFDPKKFKGAGKLNKTSEEIDRECRKLRDEWERNF